MIQFILNNQTIETDLPAGSVVLDFLRYHKQLTGTKIGCREGDCGACTILVGALEDNRVVYKSMTSCLMPLGNARGKHIVSIEGVNLETLSQVQQAMVDNGGTQCGFCTPGFVVSLVGFCLSEKPKDYDNAISAIDGNICRCTGYKSIERAALAITKKLSDIDPKEKIQWLVKENFIPNYFETIEDRLQTLANTLKTNNNKSFHNIVGGGTDLFVQKPEAMRNVDLTLVSDNHITKGIQIKNDICQMGSATTAEELQENLAFLKLFPQIKSFMKLVSSTQIRNMGTIAGNIVNASPIGDLSIFFLGLDATLILNNESKQREIKLREFYKAYKQFDKKENEIIEAIYFTLPLKSSFYNFEKVSKRTHLDIASVNSAILIEMNDQNISKVHVSAGGVAPFPLYLKKTADYLLNKEINVDVIQEANKIAQTEISPISDARGSENYKRLLLRQLLYAHFLKLFPQNVQLKELIT